MDPSPEVISAIVARDVRRLCEEAPKVSADVVNLGFVVNVTHKLARFSRDYLFAWRIGIDDADNGVLLPEQFGLNIPGLANANVHSPIHTKLHHTEVASRLLLRRRQPASAGRAELQDMRAEMIAGTFPYKKAKK